MRTAFAILVIALGLAGCEGTGIVNTPYSPNHAYKPVDGRDVDFDDHHPGADTPVWPADVDTGASSGTR